MNIQNEKRIEEYEKRIEYLEKKLRETDLLIKNILKESINPIETSIHYEKNSSHKSIEKIQDVESKEDVYQLIKIILNNLPLPAFIKDENYKYLLMNSFEAELFGLTEEEIIGKGDADFVKNLEDLELIQQTDFEVIHRRRKIELSNQNFTLANGRSYIFKTYKIPFINPLNGKTNILGYSIDVTDSINLNNLRKFIFNKMV